MSPTLYEGPPPTGKPGPTGLRKMKVDSNRKETQASPLFVFGGIVLVIALGSYLYFHGNTNAAASKAPATLSAMESIKQRLQLPDAVRVRLGMKPAEDKRAKKRNPAQAGDKEESEPAGPAPLQEKPFDPYQDTTLLLTNGERVTGELVREDAQRVVLKWDYGEATFKRPEIVQLIRPLSKTAQPAGKAAFIPGDSLVLTLRNGEALTGELVQELPDEWVIRFDFGEVNFKKAEVSSVKLATAL